MEVSNGAIGYTLFVYFILLPFISAMFNYNQGKMTWIILGIISAIMLGFLFGTLNQKLTPEMNVKKRAEKELRKEGKI